MIQDTKASATSQQAVGSWEAAGIELNIQGSTAAIIGQLRKDMQQKTSWGGGGCSLSMLTGLWRSVHAISARMSILRVEADFLTGKVGRPASKQQSGDFVSMTIVTSTCKGLTMVKLHAQHKS